VCPKHTWGASNSFDNLETGGVYHLQKNSGNFPLRISIGRSAFHLNTSLIRLQAPLCCSLEFPAKTQNGNYVARSIRIFSWWEKFYESEDDGEIIILSAAATFMRRDLHRNQGYYEYSLPAYSIDAFKSHFRMARATMEGFCREKQATGRVPQR